MYSSLFVFLGTAVKIYTDILLNGYSHPLPSLHTNPSLPQTSAQQKSSPIPETNVNILTAYYRECT